MRKGLHQDLIKRLEDIVGEKYVRKDDENLEKYSRDETMGQQAFPDVVVKVFDPKGILNPGKIFDP